MKKYSKLIALLTVAVFVLGFAGVAFAADQADTAANRLKTLGIVEGDPSGDLRLDDSITRAEFAKISVMAAGLEDAAAVLAGSQPQFSDVKANVWYTGWVNVASAQGFIKGDGDGTYRPNDEITGAEVVTVLLRLLGYNDNLSGNWPVDYIVKAADLEITKDANFTANVPAVRGDVFVMAEATLGEDVMEWDAEKAKFVDKYDDATSLLADSYEGVSDDGIVGNVNWDDGVMKVDVVTVKDDKVKVTSYEVAENAVVSGAPSILAMAGSEFDYILNDDDEIIYAEATSTDVVTDDEMTYDDSAEKITIDDETYDVLDGMQVAYGDGDNYDLVDGDYAKSDKVTVILEDGDAKWAVVTNYSDPSIFDEVDGDYLTFEEGSGDVDLDGEDYQIVKNGALVSVDDLVSGDLVYVFPGIRGLDYLIVASDQVVSGNLDGFSSARDKITVDGTKYDIDKSAGTVDALVSDDDGDNYGTNSTLDKNMVDEAINVILSPVGDAVVIVSDVDASEDFYGILVDTNDSGWANEAKVFTAAGDKVVYDLDTDKVTISGSSITDGPVTIADEEFFKFELNNDGEIDAIAEAGNNSYATDDTSSRIELAGTWTRITDDTVIIAKDSDGWIVTSWDIFKDSSAVDSGNDASTNNFVAVVDGNEVDYIVYGGVVTDSGNYGVILNTGYNADGYYYDLVSDAEEVRYSVSDSAYEGIAKGTAVDFTLSDGDIDTISAISGIVENYKVVSSGSDYVKLIKLVTSGTDKGDEVANSEKYFDTDDETAIVDASGSTKKVVSSVARGQVVSVYEKDKDGFVGYIVINEDSVADFIGASSGSGSGDVASGDYTVISFNVTTEILALKDADDNVKTFGIPSAGSTLVEETDGTVTDITNSTELNAGDEVNITLTEGTTDVTYITVKVDN